MHVLYIIPDSDSFPFFTLRNEFALAVEKNRKKVGV